MAKRKEDNTARNTSANVTQTVQPMPKLASEVAMKLKEWEKGAMNVVFSGEVMRSGVDRFSVVWGCEPLTLLEIKRKTKMCL